MPNHNDNIGEPKEDKFSLSGLILRPARKVSSDRTDGTGPGVSGRTPCTGVYPPKLSGYRGPF